MPPPTPNPSFAPAVWRKLDSSFLAYSHLSPVWPLPITHSQTHTLTYTVWSSLPTFVGKGVHPRHLHLHRISQSHSLNTQLLHNTQRHPMLLSAHAHAPLHSTPLFHFTNQPQLALATRTHSLFKLFNNVINHHILSFATATKVASEWVKGGWTNAAHWKVLIDLML